ncbi:MAG: RDD family protein, partial [Nitrospirales bacterium]
RLACLADFVILVHRLEEGGALTEGEGADPVQVGVYPKAQILNRFIAKFIDLIVVAAASKVAPPVGWLAGLTYVLIADGFSGGRSLGKRLIGLQTVVPLTREASGFRESIIRNLPLALAYLLFPVPYVGWGLAFAITVFEALLIIGNDQGLRLGDELAHTQVLDAGQLDLRD